MVFHLKYFGLYYLFENYLLYNLYLYYYYLPDLLYYYYLFFQLYLKFCILRNLFLKNFEFYIYLIEFGNLNLKFDCYFDLDFVLEYNLYYFDYFEFGNYE